MFTTYVVVTLMAIAANTFAVTADFMRFKFVLITAAKVGVSESWLPMLGTLKQRARSDCWSASSACHWSGRPPQSASSCSSSVPSSPTCAYATTRSARRPRSSCWPWPCEPSRIRLRLQSLRRTESRAAVAIASRALAIWLAEEDQRPNLSYSTCSSWTKGAPSAPFVGGCVGGNLENGFVASLPLDAAQESGPECVEGEFSEVRLPLYGVLRS